MPDRNKQIDKIKALLSKTTANGATEAEMMAALDKAAAQSRAYSVLNNSMTTKAEYLKRAKRDIAAGEKSYRSAANHIAGAQAQGATQSEIAAKVGKAQSWVSRLLKWRKDGFKDDSPFDAENAKKKLSVTDKSSHDKILAQAKAIRLQRDHARREGVRKKIAAGCKAPPPLQGLSQRYAIIYADPPWKHPADTKGNRSPSNHYPVMPLDDIMALPVSEIATPDALLFLWTTNSLLADAIRVMEAWDFEYVVSAVWVKPSIGMGFYFRNQHELLLLGKRGDVVPPKPADRPSSILHAPNAMHSAKPEQFYDIIERMYPDFPKIELFARSARDGWASWGNQVPTLKKAA